MDEKFMKMPEGQHALDVVDFLVERGYNVIYVALYGAQNYNLQRESSDYDYKAVVVPKLEDIVFNAKPTSLTLDLPFDGQVDVKDIRLMVDQWKKGSSNFTELLFSKWYWVNPDYPPMMFFRYFNEAIAHANEASALRAMLGQMEEKFHALDHPYPVQVDEVNEYGYAAKQLSHEMRLYDMMCRFYTDPYSDLLDPTQNPAINLNYWNSIRDIKTRKVSLPKDEAIKLGKQLVEDGRALYKAYEEKGFYFAADILEAMDKAKFEIIKIALKKELREEEEVN